jgi:hypothetical protein
MNSRHFVFGALFFLLIFSSCKKNTIPANTSAPVQLNKANVLNLDFTNFNGKGKIQVEDEGDKISSGITVRMRKDSIIWISVVPALGIEAARIVVTKDSVHMLNRLKREYFSGDYSVLKNKYKVDLNFNLLQAMLLGNYLPALNNQEKFVAEAPYQHSRQKMANLLIDQYLDGTNAKLKKITIKDQESKNSIVVDYSKFEPLGDTPFARASLIVVQQGEGEKTKGAIANLDFTKINLNEANLTFPFSVPQGYKKQ